MVKRILADILKANDENPLQKFCVESFFEIYSKDIVQYTRTKAKGLFFLRSKTRDSNVPHNVLWFQKFFDFLLSVGEKK